MQSHRHMIPSAAWQYEAPLTGSVIPVAVRQHLLASRHPSLICCLMTESHQAETQMICGERDPECQSSVCQQEVGSRWQKRETRSLRN